MKILGADGLTIGINAMDQIPSSYLSVGDACLSKFDDKFYFYVIEDSGLTEDLPDVVVPADLADNKRWILKSFYVSDLIANDLFANSLSQASSGVPLILNNVASLSGDTFTFTNLLTAPFISNSTTMVDNLNSEYWGGIHWSEFSIDSLIQSGDEWIGGGADEITVVFTPPRFNATYSLFTELINIAGSEPSLISTIVTNKTLLGFTVKLSSATDSASYRLQWAILGENIDAEEYNLLDTSSNQLTDINGIPFTVI